MTLTVIYPPHHSNPSIHCLCCVPCTCLFFFSSLGWVNRKKKKNTRQNPTRVLHLMLPAFILKKKKGESEWALPLIVLHDTVMWWAVSRVWKQRNNEYVQRCFFQLTLYSLLCVSLPSVHYWPQLIFFSSMNHWNAIFVGISLKAATVWKFISNIKNGSLY